MYNPQLETFIRVADAGSFNKAAEQSYITPTAVIKQINLLEANLGVTLFKRTHRGLTLTKAGTSLYNDAKYVIQYCKDSITRAKNAMQEGDHVIRIGTSPMTPAGVLVELWPKIHTLCPQIKFQLIPFENTPENAREILKNLGQNIDIIAGIFDDTMLGAYTNCSHGAGLAVLYPVYCRHIYKDGLAKFQKFVVNVWGISPEGKTAEALARAGVEALSDFIREIGLPATLRELGVNESTDLKAIADSCNPAPGSCRKINHEEILRIFQECG